MNIEFSLAHIICSKMTTLRLGTRKSNLAIAQAHLAQRALSNQGVSVSIVGYQTSADTHERPLRLTEGKGLFIKELERGLLKGDIDIAVHSYKDVPYDITKSLVVAGVLEREDPRDVLLTRSSLSLDDFKAFQGIIGTCSLRRVFQLRPFFPKAHIVDIRGNIQTRIRKMNDGTVDALILAYAGLRRLNYEGTIAHIFATSDLIPSPTQGTIALQCRKEDTATQNVIKTVTHEPTQDVSHIERGFVTAIEGTCHTPLAGYAQRTNEQMVFKGMLAAPDGSALVRLEDTASLDTIHNFFNYGHALGQKIRRMHHAHTHRPQG